MTELKEGQRVRVVSGTEEREATFVQAAAPDEAIEVPHEGGTRKVDAAWIQFDDGEMNRVPYNHFRAVD